MMPPSQTFMLRLLLPKEPSDTVEVMPNPNNPISCSSASKDGSTDPCTQFKIGQVRHVNRENDLYPVNLLFTTYYSLKAMKLMAKILDEDVDSNGIRCKLQNHVGMLVNVPKAF
jgi:hypothetical protein